MANAHPKSKQDKQINIRLEKEEHFRRNYLTSCRPLRHMTTNRSWPPFAQSTVNIFGPAVRLSFLLKAFSSLIPSQSCCSTRSLPSSCFPIIAGKYRPYADTKALHSSEAASVPSPPISYPYSVLGFYLNINWIEPSFNSIKICSKC